MAVVNVVEHVIGGIIENLVPIAIGMRVEG
jgi:hypothetical protein